MLAKKFRLPIKNIFLSGWMIKKGRYFLIKRRTNNLPFSRFGVIVSRRVDKRAARRNRLRRIIFNLVGLKKYHLRAGMDFLITAYAATSRAEESEVKAELINLLESK